MSTNTMARRSNLRASDADREQVAERLRKAAAEGRLRADELEQRLGATFAALTYGELDALVADLPEERVAPPRRPLARMRTPVLALGIALAAAAVVALVTLLVTGTAVVGGAWILFALWGFGGCRGARCRTRYSRYPRRGW
jgi:hypothetical protein